MIREDDEADNKNGGGEVVTISHFSFEILISAEVAKE